ncbi:RsmD family RNA methyltransferase [Synechococcus sp. BA-124 BA4]|uniref:RsmD family RNA methyltransferase n=1 Tax=unclassified Synechococcus TaxID=2626047 RepID=UPI0018CEE671|nr:MULTISPECIES: RsmD family RNA methyltransferase [unclassified Synechococcus]MEA5400454.1 RsmD family RNA methyltransferase [Synechococcus sp. BA-124 BA4]QPN57152.1 RsmD family RNA methyltransferase [Synechococcus sp. CBW1107]CAK6694050.1 Ribosomal RNA small subunit methyltransferase D [Synechococcus sp. CBW1107]
MSLRLSGGRRLLSPQGLNARPTSARVRLAVLNLLAAELSGCRWLDLCCGSGVMSCEVLQRCARRVVAVDHDRTTLGIARRNLEAVRASVAGACDLRLIRAELPEWLCRGPGQQLGEEAAGGFDLIYADPPFASGLYAPIAEAVSTSGWLAEGGRLLWECSSETYPDVPPGWQLSDRRRYGSCGLMILVPAVA